MEIDVTESEETGVPTPAVSLEISSEIAEQAEDLLSEFAEDAGLETALIVDRGGALVTGISSEEDVTVDVISGLVAGASSAMRALVEQLGDTGEIESLHQGGKRLLYIREIVTRFILVGVSDSSFPPGIVREKASQLQPKLADLLREVKPIDDPEPDIPVKPKSLRAVAAERAAAKVEVEVLQEGSSSGESVEEENLEPEDEESVFEEDGDTDTAAVLEPLPPEEETEEKPSNREPVEVLEPLDLGEPEIVIENSSIDEDEASPFELEDEEESTEEKEAEAEGAAEPAESVFELEDGDESEYENLTATSESPVFGWIEEEEGDTTDESPAPEEGEETTEPVFEYDGAEEEADDAEEEIANSDPDVSENSGEEETVEEETESRNTGPFYF